MSIEEKLHVVISAYNGGGVIEDTLRSIYLDPTIDVVHSVVVANGCQDDTVSTVRRYQKYYPNITLFVADKRIGRNKAINQGLSMIPEEAPVLILGQENMIEGLGSFMKVAQDKALVLPTMLCVFEEAEGLEADLINGYNTILKYAQDGAVCQYGVYGFGMNGRKNLPGGFMPECLASDDVVVSAFYDFDEVGYPNTIFLQRFLEKTLEEVVWKRALYTLGGRQVKEAEKMGKIPPTKRWIDDERGGMAFFRRRPITSMEQARELGLEDEYAAHEIIMRKANALAEENGEEILAYWLGED